MELVSSLPRRALLAASVAAALVLAPLSAAMTAPAAHADTAPVPPEPTTTVSADSLPTVQINGIAWSQLVVGNRVYVTGQFTQSRPAGAAAGTNQTARSNILAYDLTTGALVTSFAPTLNAQGLALAASPDGSRIYVAGDFTNVSGTSRQRIAALNATTGALITSFNASANGRVRSIATGGDTVYIGGTFSTAGGQPRSRLAAFAAANGAVTTWNPGADAEVFAVVAPNGNKIVVGGRFATLGGAANYGLGAVDATTGAPLPFAAKDTIRNGGPDAAVWSLATNGTSVFGTGYTYLVNPGSENTGNFEATFAADAATGNIQMISGCRGDTYSSYPIGDVLYSAGHPHDCGMVGGNPQTDPWTYQRAMAQTIGQGPGAAVNMGGAFNGMPAPMNLHWLPTVPAGTFTGQGQAAWSVSGNSNYVVLGGEFPTVNGGAQQGLARFAVRTIAPNRQGPQGGTDLKPTIVSLAPGSLRVSWRSAWDRDNKRLTYEVLRGANAGTATVVATRTGDATWWSRPPMAVTDAGLTPGSSQTYRVRATDPLGNVVTSATTVATVPSGSPGSSAYRDAVTGDGATSFWRLGEDDGTTAYDWASADDLTLDASATRGVAGAINDDPDKATDFAGNVPVPATAATYQTGPSVFTAEAWIKTTTTSGGKIVSFGNSDTGISGSYDRHVYMGNDGKIVFGVYPNAVRTVQSGKSYNDGQWHHIVASLGSGGMNLYVDGRRVGTRTDTTTAQGYSGYWRIGGDNIDGWPNRPASRSFAGTIDDVAIYPTVLTAAQAAQHYVVSGRDPGLPTKPADAYGGAVYDAQPDLYWRLDETSGSSAVDVMTNDAGGTYSSGVELGGAGSPAASAGRSVTLPGGQQTVVATQSHSNPQVFSMESWFRTTTNSGGRIMGFGNASAGNTSGNYDRHVYMLDDGRLRYGIWTGQASIVDSPEAYNDGDWHHLAITQGPDGQRMYVDGDLVGTGSATSPQGYTGYWRLGSDNTWGGASTNDFAGSLDEFAVYPTVLPASTVSQHWVLGGGGPGNLAPTAAFTSSATGLMAAFDATGSSDTDGTIASYAWEFGDGDEGTGPTPSHLYDESGTFQVKLTVTDDDGATATVTHPVTVAAANVPPAADFTSSVTDLTASFDSSDSADSDGTITSHAWEFGDGATSTSANPSRTYAAAGTYQVKLTVTDDDGGTGTVTKPVTVTAPQTPNTPPTASFTSTTNNLAASFDGSGSNDPDGSIASYAWDFGDGTTGTGVSPNRTYGSAGTYTVTLTVTDDDGATGTRTNPVTVTAAGSPPVAADTFSRTTASGWGSAGTGGAWSVTGSSVAYSVADGSGRASVPLGRTGTLRLPGASSDDTDLTHTFWLESVPTGGGAYLSTTARSTSAGDYRVKLRVMSSGQVTSQLIKVVGTTETALASAVTVPGLTYTAGLRLAVRVQATGTSPTTLRAKVWSAAGSEPTAWLSSVTDSTAGLQAAGSVGWVAYTSSSATATVVFRFDDLLAVEN